MLPHYIFKVTTRIEFVSQVLYQHHVLVANEEYLTSQFNQCIHDLIKKMRMGIAVKKINMSDHFFLRAGFRNFLRT
jgi:hypothetical protein